jgi:DNA repair exonuclease SbcCD nuclease subunit
MSTFRFIHTGDIHLDSPLKGLAGQEGAAAERIRTATRAAFANLVDLAIEEDVGFFVIAGDLYDGDWRDFQTGLFFVGQMGRLSKAGIPVFLLFGNHDAENQISRRLTLPDNVHRFSSRKPQTFRLKDLRVALHGQSFRDRDVTDNLVPAYPEPVEGAFNIGVLHTGLGGMGGHANYAPCSIDDLVNKGYDYWALAHVHQGQVLHENPHVVFCGNLQGRHVRETGPKGARLVTVEDGRVSAVSTVETDVVRWAHLRFGLEGSRSFADVVARVQAEIECAVVEAGSGRLLACRIELTGPTDLHDLVLSSREQLTAEARAAALALGEEAAWIERLVIGTEPPLSASPSNSDEADALRAIVAETAADPAFHAQLEADLGELLRKLPHDVRTDLDRPLIKTATEGDFKQLAVEAGGHLAARLFAEEI